MIGKCVVEHVILVSMESSSRPTMRDVAQRAGVSLKTVSRVVNGETGVSPQTSHAVQQAIEEIGYQADLQARSLRRGDRKTQSIGLLVSSVSNPFDAQVHRAIEEVAAARRTAVLALSSRSDRGTEERQVTALSQRQVDGLIVACSGEDQSYLRDLADRIPVVFIDREPSEPLGDVVVSDHRVGAWRATRHLLQRGHRRIALLADRQDIASARMRRQGYEQALSEAGVEIDPALVRTDLLNEQAGRMAAHEMLSGPRPPTAIFASQNELAIGAMRAMRHLELDGKIALVSFDDVPYADLFSIPLTAITQDPWQIGERAAQRLLGRIAGDITGPAERIVVQTGFEVRGSGEIRPADVPR